MPFFEDVKGLVEGGIDKFAAQIDSREDEKQKTQAFYSGIGGLVCTVAFFVLLGVGIAALASGAFVGGVLLLGVAIVPAIFAYDLFKMANNSGRTNGTILFKLIERNLP